MANIGPVRMAVAGDRFTQGCRILAVLWVGATTAGDRVTVSDPSTGAILWPARTDSTNTYLGANFGREGIHAPNGFTLSQVSSGEVYVYLREV